MRYVRPFCDFWLRIKENKLFFKFVTKFLNTNIDCSWTMPFFYVFWGANDNVKNKDVTGENLSVRNLTWLIRGGNWGLMCRGGSRPFVSKQVI